MHHHRGTATGRPSCRNCSSEKLAGRDIDLPLPHVSSAVTGAQDLDPIRFGDGGAAR